MIIRTVPNLPPAPDVVRAMERLEAQLRRAADDLAATLAALEAPVPVEEVPCQPVRLVPVCGKWMRYAKDTCARRPGHANHCRSRLVMDADAAARYSGRRPRVAA
jgi:hypothetical protein